MCGIGAILDPAGTSGQHAAERMVEALRHRGPDGEALRRIGPGRRSPTRGCRSSMSPAATSRWTRGRPGHPRQRRDLQRPRAARGARGSVATAAHRLGRRGVRARLRGAGARLGAAAERDLRVRDLGSAPAAVVAARDAFGVEPLYRWAPGPGALRGPPRSARCSPLGSAPSAAPDLISRSPRSLLVLRPRPRAALFQRRLQARRRPSTARGRGGGSAPRIDELARGARGAPIAGADDELAGRARRRASPTPSSAR